MTRVRLREHIFVALFVFPRFSRRVVVVVVLLHSREFEHIIELLTKPKDGQQGFHVVAPSIPVSVGEGVQYTATAFAVCSMTFEAKRRESTALKLT